MVPDGADGPDKPKPIGRAGEVAGVERAPEASPIAVSEGVSPVQSPEEAAVRLTDAINAVKSRLGASQLHDEDQALRQVLAEYYGPRTADLEPAQIAKLVAAVKSVLKHDPVIGQALKDLIDPS